jgi:prefoldin subunit 5
MSRSDVKEVGEMLDDSEAALIVVGEATIERAVDDATKRAKKELKKIRTEARKMERAVDGA